MAKKPQGGGEGDPAPDAARSKKKQRAPGEKPAQPASQSELNVEDINEQSCGQLVRAPDAVAAFIVFASTAEASAIYAQVINGPICKALISKVADVLVQGGSTTARTKGMVQLGNAHAFETARGPKRLNFSLILGEGDRVILSKSEAVQGGLLVLPQVQLIPGQADSAVDISVRLEGLPGSTVAYQVKGVPTRVNPSPEMLTTYLNAGLGGEFFISAQATDVAGTCMAEAVKLPPKRHVVKHSGTSRWSPATLEFQAVGQAARTPVVTRALPTSKQVADAMSQQGKQPPPPPQQQQQQQPQQQQQQQTQPQPAQPQQQRRAATPAEQARIAQHAAALPSGRTAAERQEGEAAGASGHGAQRERGLPPPPGGDPGSGSEQAAAQSTSQLGGGARPQGPSPASPLGTTWPSLGEAAAMKERRGALGVTAPPSQQQAGQGGPPPLPAHTPPSPTSQPDTQGTPYGTPQLPLAGQHPPGQRGSPHHAHPPGTAEAQAAEAARAQAVAQQHRQRERAIAEAIGADTPGRPPPPGLRDEVMRELALRRLRRSGLTDPISDKRISEELSLMAVQIEVEALTNPLGPPARGLSSHFRDALAKRRLRLREEAVTVTSVQAELRDMRAQTQAAQAAEAAEAKQAAQAAEATQGQPGAKAGRDRQRGGQDSQSQPTSVSSPSPNERKSKARRTDSGDDGPSMDVGDPGASGSNVARNLHQPLAAVAEEPEHS
jgi:hypothetical protein